jgi:hypothetical protein
MKNVSTIKRNSMLSFKKFIKEGGGFETRDRYNQNKLKSVLNPNPDENKYFQITKHILTLHSKGVRNRNAWNDAVEKFGTNGKIEGYPKDIGIRLHHHPDYNKFKEEHNIPDYVKPEPQKKKRFDHTEKWVGDAAKEYIRNTKRPSLTGLTVHIGSQENYDSDFLGKDAAKKILSHHNLEFPTPIPVEKPEPKPKPKQISDEDFMKTHNAMDDLSYREKTKKMNDKHGTSMSSGSYQKRLKKILGS